MGRLPTKNLPLACLGQIAYEPKKRCHEKTTPVPGGPEVAGGERDDSLNDALRRGNMCTCQPIPLIGRIIDLQHFFHIPLSVATGGRPHGNNTSWK